MSPEYLSPGVYVEEVDKGTKPIEGAGTAMAAFVGFAEQGPVNQPTFVALAPSLGVDVCVSPRLATAKAILKYVRRGDVLSMDVIEACEAEVMEIVLPASSRVLDKELKSISIPRGSIIGAIVRGDDVIIPSGNDRLQTADRVIVFALPGAVVKVEKFFS